MSAALKAGAMMFSRTGHLIVFDFCLYIERAAMS